VYLKLNDNDAAIRTWEKALEFDEKEEGLRRESGIRFRN